MRNERDGFWVVLYPTSSATRDEVPRLVAWLQTEFEVVADEEWPPLRLLHCRQREGNER
jgi:hypothetical protein